MAKATHRRGTTSWSHVDQLGSYHGITEHVLRSNGLRILHHHDPNAPVVGLMVTYLVGSRHEAVGHTGATHLLEHLMFKGSKQFPPKKRISVLDRFSAVGALVNASTWLDRTNYYEVMPDEHFEFALRVEADRMRHALITERDRAEEMPAVRSEYAMRVENEPEELLDQHVWATAFMAHPYHHPTIGWQSDFEQVSLARLRHFYDTYYWPNNAVVTVVGSIALRETLSLIEQTFGRIPSSPHPIPVPYTTEPVQQGRRFCEIVRPGVKNIVSVAFKVPEALHGDTPALLVLQAVLAEGLNARLYRALVERRLCTDVQSTYRPFRDPSLFPLIATCSEDVKHEQVEVVIRSECQRIAQRGVDAQELSRVLANLETSVAFARDGHLSMLNTLNEAIACGNWHFFFDLPEMIKRVTADQVRDVARTYLVEDRVTVGHYRST